MALHMKLHKSSVEWDDHFPRPADSAGPDASQLPVAHVRFKAYLSVLQTNRMTIYPKKNFKLKTFP